MSGKKGALRKHERAFRLFDEFHMTVAEIDKEMNLIPGEGRQLIIKKWTEDKQKKVDKWEL